MKTQLLLPMAKSIIIIKGILLIFLIMQPVCSAAAIGYLSIRLEPGTFALLDSQLIANHSFENMALTAGTYLLHVYDPRDYSWQDRGFSEKITIQEAETLLFDLRQKNKLRILSSPTDGQVYVDSLFLGRTPLILYNPGLENKSVTVYKTGYQNSSFTLSSGENEYSLLLNPAAEPAVPAIHQTRNSGQKPKLLDEGLIITSLAGSWLSFLFKRKADTYYNKYLHTARRNEISKYYDRSVQFDRYAEISITVSLLALGGYFYLLLKE